MDPKGATPKRTPQKLVQRLLDVLDPLDARTRKESVQRLAERVVSTFGGAPHDDGALVVELVSACDVALATVARLELTRAQLLVDHRNAITPRARRELLAQALRGLAGSPRKLRGDLRALARFLDLEAVQERFGVAISLHIDDLEVAYRAASAVLKARADAQAPLEAFAGGRSLEVAFRHASQGRRDPVRKAALLFLEALLGQLPARDRLRTFGAARLAQLSAWAEGKDMQRFVQVAALRLLCKVAREHAYPSLHRVLSRQEPGDAVIARRNALLLASELALAPEQLLTLVTLATQDPSEHVRQQLAWTLAAHSTPPYVERLCAVCIDDESPRVRGVALRALVTVALARPALVSRCEAVVQEVLEREAHRVDHTVALESVARLSLGPEAPSRKARFTRQLVALVSRNGVAPELVARATGLLRRLEVEAAPLIEQTRQQFVAILQKLPEGKRTRAELVEPLSLRDLELALGAAAQGDLTVSLRKLGPKSVEIARGEPRKLRVWRLIHELLHLAPDKRKAHAHAHARAPLTGSVVPTQLLGEVTPTRVPGERRLHPRHGDWGMSIPRVDDMLGAAGVFAEPVRLVLPLGVLTIAGPKGLFARMKAWWILTLRYAFYDNLRERSLEGEDAAQRTRFVRAMQALGFSVVLGDTSGAVEDEPFDLRLPRITQYLGVAFPLALPDFHKWWDAPLVYILSPTGNVPWHLALLVFCVLAGFLVRAAVIMGRIEHARRSVPLSIGGWGTRGKSGTERLKAALFHALRYDVVVKTTGCEAMFIHARKDMPAREIFLYRPYDKATIWEQRKVLEYAYKLKAQVFLWECMALNPHFVEVLNSDWMQDEVTTLTNAYPDHEDIMGPSGEEVARVIGLFTPINGVTYTAEDQMLPVLREVARSRGTNLVPVPGIEADLLPADLLARFPYDEHPRNIALVLRLAEHFGIDREVALVEMADGVVPDLGVLKTYPATRYRERILQFSNGMSANERAGFMSNWQRLGFDTLDLDRDPDVVSVAVINNRADRVARSRVFAEIMARDVNVTHMVLIGTNLTGMRAFIAEAIERQISELRFSEEADADQAGQSYDAWLRHVGAPVVAETFVKKLAIMLGTLLPEEEVSSLLARHGIVEAVAGLSDALPGLLSEALAGIAPTRQPLVDDVLAHAERLRKRVNLARTTRAAIVERLRTGDREGALALAHKTLFELSYSRLHVVESAEAKGDQVIDQIAHAVEPGHRARIMGCQNIKGTGLDFVYRWLSLQAVSDTLARAERDVQTRAEQLSWLSTYADYGLIDCLFALERVRAFIADGDQGWAPHLKLLESLENTLAELAAKKTAALSSTGKKASVWERVLTKQLEPLLDHWDSVRRTRESTQIVNDLFALRVGQGRAALLLRELVARQKGGWLYAQLRSVFARERAR